MSKRKKKAATLTCNTEALNALGIKLELIGALLDVVHDRMQNNEDQTAGSTIYAAMTIMDQANELYTKL